MDPDLSNATNMFTGASVAVSLPVAQAASGVSPLPLFEPPVATEPSRPIRLPPLPKLPPPDPMLAPPVPPPLSSPPEPADGSNRLELTFGPPQPMAARETKDNT
jgi:hypothetical protein